MSLCSPDAAGDSSSQQAIQPWIYADLFDYVLVTT